MGQVCRTVMVGSWISMNREGTKTLKLDLFYRKIDILTLWGID